MASTTNNVQKSLSVSNKKCCKGMKTWEYERRDEMMFIYDRICAYYCGNIFTEYALLGNIWSFIVWLCICKFYKKPCKKKQHNQLMVCNGLCEYFAMNEIICYDININKNGDLSVI